MISWFNRALFAERLKSAWARLRHAAWPSAADVQQPLMSAGQIAEFAQEVDAIASRMLVNPHSSEALRQGEQHSRFMGSGLEYAESRPYQPGDEIRRMHWRLMARTGRAYTKLFQESRQESWFILLDQRQSMRFGTQVRLKAEQGLRVAGYFLWLAQRAAIPVAGAHLAEELVFTPTFEGRSSYEQLMSRFSKPCPPVDAQGMEPHLNDVLLDLSHRVPTGSRVIVISDFHDFNAQTTSILVALQARAALKAVWIEDAAERRLPKMANGLQLQSVVSGARFALTRADQIERYQAWAEQYLMLQHNALRESGAALVSLQAHEPLSSLVARIGEAQQEGV